MCRKSVPLFCHLWISSTENSSAICLNQSNISPHYYNDSSKVYFALVFNKKEHNYFKKATSKRDVPSVLIADTINICFSLKSNRFYNRLLLLPQKRGEDISVQKWPHIYFFVFSNIKKVVFFFPTRPFLVDLLPWFSSTKQLGSAAQLAAPTAALEPHAEICSGGCRPWRQHFHRGILKQTEQLLVGSDAAALTTMRFKV